MNHYLLTILAILTLTACQSTGVVPMDHGNYMIGKKDGSPGLGVSLSNKGSVYQEANTFCHKNYLEVETINLTVSPASFAKLGSTELEFKCIKKSD